MISASATSIFLVSEWLEHYHQERPQHALDNEPLNKSKLRGRPAKQMGPIGRQTLPLSYLRFMQQLGGLLKKLQPTGGVKFRPSMLADDAIRPALIRGIRQFGTAVALPSGAERSSNALSFCDLAQEQVAIRLTEFRVLFDVADERNLSRTFCCLVNRNREFSRSLENAQRGRRMAKSEPGCITGGVQIR